MNQLTNQDLHYVVSRLPKDILKLMTEQRLFLGGGFIRETLAGEKANDIDLFGPSKDMLRLAAQMLSEKREGRFFGTDNAFTVLAPPRMPVQFISRWLFDQPEVLLTSFDFTVCQVVVWHENERWHSICADEFYSDLAARRLTYTFPVREEAAGGSMMRVRKFLRRGYNIQATSLAGVISRILSAVRDNPNFSDERQRAQIIAGLLQEVDPLRVIDGIDLGEEKEVA